jgi:hypothetical protein
MQKDLPTRGFSIVLLSTRLWWGKGGIAGTEMLDSLACTGF